ncbi:baseplate wedge subunit [Proteus phage PM2]|uniref:Baseplate wedge subunit n=1 Tax=Proteus phage PM2 TaxID=2025809 RepID=A0A249XWT9_9CAUD|nr:baseplate wedge subunit [Proteus phage PM2]ASZ76445.1 baseplate wedge subunit [Proteus phage PM2]
MFYTLTWTLKWKKGWDKDLHKVVGDRAVKNSILGIISTRKGSRPFDPEFGCNITDQLFENMSPLIEDTIERSIVSAIKNYEPRVQRLKVSVTTLYDSNSIIVDIIFSIVDNPDTLEQIKVQLSK